MPQLLDLIPPHDLYVEVFTGSGALFFNKEPTKSILNDLDKDVVYRLKLLKKVPLFDKKEVNNLDTVKKYLDKLVSKLKGPHEKIAEKEKDILEIALKTLEENKMLTLVFGPTIYTFLKVLQLLVMLTYVFVCQLILISTFSGFRCKIGLGYVEISTQQSSTDRNQPHLQIQDTSLEPSS
jgi:hypothetical protein